MTLPNNSAGRLYEILKKASTLAGNITLIEGWRISLGLDETVSDWVVMAKVGELIDLVEVVKNSFESHPNKDVYLRNFGELEKIFSFVNFQTTWNNIKTILTVNILYSIEVSSLTLKDENIENPIETKELNALLKKVNDLIEDVRESEISQDIKDALLESLFDLSLAIQSYRLSGSEGLKRALQKNIGAFLIYGKDIDKSLKQKTRIKMYEMIKFVVELLDLGITLAQLPVNFSNLLPPPQ